MLHLSVVQLGVEAVILKSNYAIYQLDSGYNLYVSVGDCSVNLYFETDTECANSIEIWFTDGYTIDEFSNCNVNGNEMTIAEWVEYVVEAMDEQASN